MRVVSNSDAESGTIKVRFVSSKEEGVVIGHNGKSLKIGRKYKVKVGNSEREVSGSELERID
jgi:hypothetical protein